jgi:hypothetical protein
MAETNGNGNGRIKIEPSVLLQIVIYLAMLGVAWGALNARIDAMQSRYDEVMQDVREMRGDIKLILQRVK